MRVRVRAMVSVRVRARVPRYIFRVRVREQESRPGESGEQAAKPHRSVQAQPAYQPTHGEEREEELQGRRTREHRPKLPGGRFRFRVRVRVSRVRVSVSRARVTDRVTVRMSWPPNEPFTLTLGQAGSLSPGLR